MKRKHVVLIPIIVLVCIVGGLIFRHLRSNYISVDGTLQIHNCLAQGVGCHEYTLDSDDKKLYVLYGTNYDTVGTYNNKHVQVTGKQLVSSPTVGEYYLRVDKIELIP